MRYPYVQCPWLIILQSLAFCNQSNFGDIGWQISIPSHGPINIPPKLDRIPQLREVTIAFSRVSLNRSIEDTFQAEGPGIASEPHSESLEHFPRGLGVRLVNGADDGLA